MNAEEGDRIRLYDNTVLKTDKGYLTGKTLHIHGARYAGGVLGKWSIVQDAFNITSTLIPAGSLVIGDTTGFVYKVKTGADTTIDPEGEVYDPATGESTNYINMAASGILSNANSVAIALSSAGGNPIGNVAAFFWEAATTFTHPVYVVGSNSMLYKSKVAGDLMNDPVSNPADWDGPYLLDVPAKNNGSNIFAWNATIGALMSTGDYAVLGGKNYRLTGDGTVDPSGAGGSANWDGPFLFEAPQQIQDAVILKWTSGNSSSYVHPIFVVGSDDQLYKSKVAGDLTQNPVGNAGVDWDGPYSLVTQQASTSSSGITKYATSPEARGIGNDTAITPLGLSVAFNRFYVVDGVNGTPSGGVDGLTFDTIANAINASPSGSYSLVTVVTDCTLSLSGSIMLNNKKVIVRGDVQARKLTLPDNHLVPAFVLSLSSLSFQRITIDWGKADAGVVDVNNRVFARLTGMSELVLGDTASALSNCIVNALSGNNDNFVISNNGFNNIMVRSAEVTGDDPTHKFVNEATRTDFNFQSSGTVLTDIVMPTEGYNTF